MKYIFLFYFILPVFVTAQEKKPSEVTHLPAENSFECVDNIYNDPEAVKQLLRRLITDKENLKQMFRLIINDPEMKNTVKELRELFKEDKDLLDNKKNTDINKAKNEMTFNMSQSGD